MKLCKECKTNKPLCLFYADKSKSDGHQNFCISCRRSKHVGLLCFDKVKIYLKEGVYDGVFLYKVRHGKKITLYVCVVYIGNKSYIRTYTREELVKC